MSFNPFTLTPQVPIYTGAGADAVRDHEIIRLFAEISERQRRIQALLGHPVVGDAPHIEGRG